MVNENIPESVQRLWIQMLQNWVGVTSPLTPTEIELKLNTCGFQQPLETTLNAMVMHGLAEEQVEIVPETDSTSERRRVVRTYQISADSLEKVL